MIGYTVFIHLAILSFIHETEYLKWSIKGNLSIRYILSKGSLNFFLPHLCHSRQVVAIYTKCEWKSLILQRSMTIKTMVLGVGKGLCSVGERKNLAWLTKYNGIISSNYAYAKIL